MKIARTTLVAAALSTVALGGCQVLAPGLARSRPAAHHSVSKKKSDKSGEDGSWFGSWFRPEEPEPPQTPMDFLALEPIRP